MSPADNYNLTVSSFHGAETNVLALEIVKDSISSAGVTMVEISLAAVSFGEYYRAQSGSTLSIPRSSQDPLLQVS